MRSWAFKTVLAVSTALVSANAIAQTPAAAPAPNSPAAVSPSKSQPQDRLLKAEENEALVASIALYPDTLLAQVLMASTYPLEIVQAERWMAANKNLKRNSLMAAVEKQSWDDSVKALVATPEVLTMMSTQLDWVRKLGDAFLAQQTDVMDAIQRLRQRAQANKKLTSTKEQKVTVSRKENKEYIVIEPATPGMVYVPYYDPAIVYGGWPYPAYPPYWWGAPAYIGGGFIAAGVVFGAGFALGRWASGGCCWGGRNIDWNVNNININRGARAEHWRHNPQHRQGVRYNNAAVSDRFGAGKDGVGVVNRMDFRGRGGDQVLKPGGDLGRGPWGGPGAHAATRPAGSQGIANRPGSDRPSAGTRPSNKPSAGNRPAGGKPSAGTRPSTRPSAGHHPSGGRPSAGMRPSSMPSAGARAGGRASAGARSSAGRGGRRSDVAVKRDIELLGRLDNGLGFYRFGYIGETQTYVGVMAQEVVRLRPDAVTRGRDGYLRVFYDHIGVRFETYEAWLARGSLMPLLTPVKWRRHHHSLPTEARSGHFRILPPQPPGART